jgi:membrane-associated protease RseP (regulator of RpoE activity)
MGNGFHPHGRTPAAEPLRLPTPVVAAPVPPRRVALPILLFLLTIVSTLFVGLHLTEAYRADQPPYSEAIFSGELFREVAARPWRLLAGWPFAATLLGILLAHELGHYFACRYYGIVASYPYFIPFPSLIGTLGAFIRIQSPIVNRRALFDVGIAGPMVGFVLAAPALAVGVAHSKVLAATGQPGEIVFGTPPLVWLLGKWFWPGVPAEQIFLHPVARAAWVGLFATALNLLPVGQLDGGHIVYALAREHHRRLSRVALLALLGGGLFGWQHPDIIWPGWLTFGLLLVALGVRHPTVIDPVEPLDARRRLVAVLGLLVFLLCFTPLPFYAPLEP